MDVRGVYSILHRLAKSEHIPRCPAIFPHTWSPRPMDRQPEKPEVRAGALRESCEDGAASSCHPSFELEETRAVLWDYGAVYRVAVSFCGLATSFLR